MEDNVDGAFDAYWGDSSTAHDQLEHIKTALNATLDPRISNEIRQEAFEYLEGVKNQSGAPNHGFKLAGDWNQNTAVRYFGLKLLEYALRYKWADYNHKQTEHLRHWVKCLAGSVRAQDELYICNKIGQLWVELSKRCWGDEWPNMDSLLVAMWEKPIDHKGVATKVMVLYILETLNEDIMNNDVVAGLRLDVLGAALSEITLPADLLADPDIARGDSQLRSGGEGWLARTCSFFSACVKEVRLGGDQASTMSFCAVRALRAMRTMMVWVNLRAAVEVNAVDALFLPFYTDDCQLHTGAAEVLHSLLNRPYGARWRDAWLDILQQVLRPERIAVLRQSFERNQVSPGQDDGKYTLQKKLSELLSVLADAIAQYPTDLFPMLDAPAFFDLLLLVLQSKSLVVSIPILHSWTKLMVCPHPDLANHVFQSLAAVLQTCSIRLLRYEAIADFDESNDEIVQFLGEDFDTIPERHAFLGNYRRYCVSVVRQTAQSRPSEALSYVLGQMRQMLESGPYCAAQGFSAARYSRTGLAVLQFDAQFQVVTNALKGFRSYLADHYAAGPENGAKARPEIDAIDESLWQWSIGIMGLRIDDPEVNGQVLQFLVFVSQTSDSSAGFVLQVVQHLLTVRLPEDPTSETYTDCVKAFDTMRVTELQKIAFWRAKDLLEVYPELEGRIQQLERENSSDSRMFWGYRAFLLLIIRRAKDIDPEARLTRLQQMLKPIYDAWTDEKLDKALESFPSFCASLGMGDLPEFYKTNGFAQVSDWASQQLDEAGQARQAEIREKSDQLPLRSTKAMLASVTERLSGGTPDFDSACQIWGGIIPVMLPKLLQMLRHAQAFHNPANWAHLPEELQMVVKRTLQDRFWQAGISNESKDEFYARVSGSKTSYEGFASVVRGTTRHIRDQTYQILLFLTRFQDLFYGIPDLAPSLADALFTDAGSLTANHLHSIVNLTTGLVQRCPPERRSHFLPPLLVQIFTKLDLKISTEWASIAHANEQSTEEDELSEEMRTESVLRHLTYSMVTFVTFVLDFDKSTYSPYDAFTTGGAKPRLREVVLSEPGVLEPLILFCTHALRMHDTRCCTAICRLFRNIIPLFQSSSTSDGQVREFICTEVLKASITSLNEPYFADMQKDISALIAQIISLYSRVSSTGQEVLLSLPNMSVGKVEKAIYKICQTASERQQRALVLELLEGVRGVSIHEAGKIEQKKAAKQAVPAQYMQVEREVNGGDDAGLDGISGLFEG